ncbi:peptidase inhibitor family I36 protein [Streptomyces sp. NPDC050636]|uniref:peptidase inhibitor family I36 protein n=1 Tax=Streptomyces sp. NPDC050636 TaxID=3154510 RepID=UPI00341CF84C
MRKLTAFSAVTAAALGVAVLPASEAQADDPLPCPMVRAVCTWSEPDGGGSLKLLFDDAPFIPEGVQSAQNQTSEPWCFFEGPFFSGSQSRQLDPGQTVRNLEFTAHSARQGVCPQ